MDILGDNEVRTLPPLASGGFPTHAAGNGPVARYVTGLPADPHEPGTFLRHGVAPGQRTKGEVLRAREARTAAARKEDLKASLRAHLGDPPRHVPLDPEVAQAVLFDDANVTGLLQRGLVARNADLGPAMQQGTALLVRSADPNATDFARRLAESKVRARVCMCM